MDDAQLEAVLDRLDAAHESGASDRRSDERYVYRVKSCIIHMQSPGAGTSMAYQVPTRNISSGGMGFLHGGFVHPGTRCVVQLISMHGTWKNAEATVVFCRYVEGLVHDVSVQFDHQVDPAEYCSQAVKTRVLLADDDPSVSRLVKLFLEQLNADVELAENGRIAVEKAQQNVYDVILMDIEMPVLDGIEAVKQLRGKGYSGTIVAATGLTEPADRQRCLEAGCDRYIGKPYDRDALAELIDSLKQEPLISSLAQERSMIPLIDAFVTELPPKLRAIEEAFAKKDDKDLEQLSRGLKGEAGGYGFEPISSAAEQVEKALIQKTPRPEVKKQVEELIKLCCLARSSLRIGPSTPAETVTA